MGNTKKLQIKLLILCNVSLADYFEFRPEFSCVHMTQMCQCLNINSLSGILVAIILRGRHHYMLLFLCFLALLWKPYYEMFPGPIILDSFFLPVMRLGCVSSRSSYITPKTLNFFKDGFIALFTNGNANIFAIFALHFSLDLALLQTKKKIGRKR